jgi:hypothetical protein
MALSVHPDFAFHQVPITIAQEKTARNGFLFVAREGNTAFRLSTSGEKEAITLPELWPHRATKESGLATGVKRESPGPFTEELAML